MGSLRFVGSHAMCGSTVESNVYDSQVRIASIFLNPYRFCSAPVLLLMLEKMYVCLCVCVCACCVRRSRVHIDTRLNNVSNRCSESCLRGFLLDFLSLPFSFSSSSSSFFRRYSITWIRTLPNVSTQSMIPVTALPARVVAFFFVFFFSFFFFFFFFFGALAIAGLSARRAVTSTLRRERAAPSTAFTTGCW